MTIEAGRKLAHYEIVEPIGKGGMGEVYRAHDTKLGRDVAIKVLPLELAQDEERLRRFQREAKVLASLNHPNIAAIFGLEHSGDTHYLVLELVPGETLAERIARGSIPLDEALDIAMQIAEALEQAHEQGFVHRDLKPPNIKLTDDGKVKVLDFGLAKAFAEETPEADSSMSPTITRDATRAGVILGTAAYMSPEQAKGKDVDRRTDIWAFGCVLFEALTGRRVFQRDDVSDTLAAVLRDEPNWISLPSEAPMGIVKLLRRCLHRDRKHRLQHIGDARLELMDAATSEPDLVAPETSSSSRKLASYAAALLVGAGLALVWSRMSAEEPRDVYRLSVSLPEGVAMRVAALAFSPDGRELVYAGNADGNEQLYVRSLDSLEARPLPGTRGGNRPFFSPDGAWVGFHDGVSDETKTVSLRSDQPSLTLSTNVTIGSGSWSDDGFIYYARPFLREVRRVAPTGSEPEVVAEADANVRFLDVLPGGRNVLATVGQDTLVLDVESAVWEPVLSDAVWAQYAPPGHLVFVRGEGLYAAAFDASTAKVLGPAVPVIEAIARGYGSGYQFALSRAGHLVYIPRWQRNLRMVRVDRSGGVEILSDSSGDYYEPGLSPNGRDVVFRDGEASVRFLDVSRDAIRRATFDIDGASRPIWSRDGKTVFFRGARNDDLSIFALRSDGSEAPQEILSFDRAFDGQSGPTDVSPDGERLVLNLSRSHDDSLAQHELFSLELNGAETREPTDLEVVVDTPVEDVNARVSPDGRWIAYQSGAFGGDWEVYVQAFPNATNRWQISAGGGRDPRWSPSGSELYYRSNDAVFSVSYRARESTFEADSPRELFRGPFITNDRSYDVFPDGEHFLMLQPADGRSVAPTEAIVVLNWHEELKRLVPVE